MANSIGLRVSRASICRLGHESDVALLSTGLRMILHRLPDEHAMKWIHMSQLKAVFLCMRCEGV
jgi:hypothetical protein